MSWGERSCKREQCKIATLQTCNVDCPEYESNGTKPDSVSRKKKHMPEGKLFERKGE